MRNIILFDDDNWEHLLPLTYTRPAAAIRCGILTIKEKWERYLEAQVSYITQEYLSDLFPIIIEEDNLVISGNVLPNPKLVRVINELDMNEAVMYEGDLVAARLSRTQFDHLIHNEQIDELAGYAMEETPIKRITRTWHIYAQTGEELVNDYHLLTRNRESQPRDPSCTWEGDDIFVESNVEAKHALLDASSGPIYLGQGAKILPGALIKGPFSLGSGSLVKMGAKIYGPTTVGPDSKVGGEINNVVIFGHSNKSHDGYLGNAVIGEWCNLGADTNCSNLKNDYGDVRLWNYALNAFEDTKQQFCGLIMADHSKSGINTMFNTGSVVGVNCNIYGGGFPSKVIPSFSWVDGVETVPYRLEKAVDVARRMQSRRQVEFDQNQQAMFSEIFQLTAQQRK